ncbi:hypothetical protein BCV72DRAFT_250122 [Rhizopus microsporus var. microsporus]|uniref:Uncharacterized protein n=1 Tax=Rhizopus microsporus var. microsporus TaxID=86635 RepID=A0A1X0R2R0_RHIZD|nr:hypothetical protein BCV72DRAFT_250122 [Rhizopus microsporus var. microsporus]
MPSFFLVPEELLQFKLTHDYISAKNQFVIDLITASLLSVSSGTHTTGNNMFIDGIECDILYMSHSVDLANLPPVIVEIQHIYYLNVYKRFHVFPILFVVCTSRTGSKALEGLFKPIQNNIDPFIDNRDIKVLETLVAFVHFLISGQQNIISIDQWDDPTITKLYLVAMGMVKNDRVEALRTIY